MFKNKSKIAPESKTRKDFALVMSIFIILFSPKNMFFQAQ